MNATAIPRKKQKRAPFDPQSSHQSTAPLAAAKEIVSTHCKSLQHDFQDLLTDSAINRFLRDMELANRKQRIVTKMEADAAYVPRSIKLKCTLHCTELAKQDAEYANLEATLQTAVKNFETSAKSTIVASTKLDIKVHRIAAKNTFCTALYTVSSAFAIKGEYPAAQVHRFANSIMVRYHEEIMPIFELDDFTTLAHLCASYVLATPATDPLPRPFVAPNARPQHNDAAAAAPVQNPYNLQEDEQINARTRKIENTISSIWRTLKTCYVDSWTVFLNQQKTNDQALQLKKMATTILTDTATATAQMQVDQEPAVTPEILQALISKSVSLATAPLLANIRKLETKISKNSNTRSPSRGASRAQTNSGGRLQQRQAGPEAGAPANASSQRNKNNNSRTSNKRSGNRNTTSDKRASKQQRRSKKGRN